MTDNEIIDALCRCGQHRECCYCNSVEECGNKRVLTKATLDLINRQKAEIEMLTEKSITAKYPHCVLWGNGAILTKSLDDYDKLIADISAETIKEFAEELKEQVEYLPRLELDGTYYFLVSKRFIDNLVKEMVGDEDGKV